MKRLLYLIIICIGATSGFAQNIGINATGALPDDKAILDISSTTSGLLIPRMTTAQRDAIISPPIGLQIFNLDTNQIEYNKESTWVSVSYKNSDSNLVYISALSDLPQPAGEAITLDGTKMYIFSGMVNISPYYLNLNGANLRGTDPSKDGVMSTVSGGVLRSTGESVFMQDFSVIPFSNATKAYDFSDATGTKYCNVFSGCSVVEIGVPSLGVGQVSGFKAITFEKNFWNCSDGIKVTGTMGKFASSLNLITNITTGSGIEFLAGLRINDIDISNNYFVYPGQTGVKVNSGALIDRGRMTTNLFRGVTTYLSGFDSYTPEWEMQQNTYIPNSRAYSTLYMNNNTTPTALTNNNQFYKIAGTTTAIKEIRFTAANNRLTYTGKNNITAKIAVVIGAKSPATSADFSIAIAKNGIIIPTPFGSIAPTTNNQSFQINLVSEIDLVRNDYIEVFIKTNNANTSTITVEEMQFQATD